MPSYSKVFYFSTADFKEKTAVRLPEIIRKPIRKKFTVEAATESEAMEILDTMAELYSKKLSGILPSEVADRLKSVPKVVTNYDEKLIRMLKGIGKRK